MYWCVVAGRKPPPCPRRMPRLESMLNKFLKLVASVPLTFLIAACAVGPNYQPPESAAASKFDGIEATYSTEQTVADFWQKFDDPMLAKLVDQALASNYDLRIALSRIAEARALRRDVAFDLAPSLQASGGYTETRVAREQTLGGAPRST